MPHSLAIDMCLRHRTLVGPLEERERRERVRRGRGRGGRRVRRRRVKRKGRGDEGVCRWSLVTVSDVLKILHFQCPQATRCQGSGASEAEHNHRSTA